MNQDGSSGFHSSQSHSNAVSSYQAPSSTTNQTAQNAPTPHRVNRAACTYNDSDEFEFDLGALGDFGKLSIRAVHSKQPLCDHDCEQFFIGSDDVDSVSRHADALCDISQFYGFDWTSVDAGCCDLSIYECVPLSNHCLREDRPWKPTGTYDMSFA